MFSIQFLIALLFIGLEPLKGFEFTIPELDAYWKTYKVQHGKQYASDADDYFRKYTFGMNLNSILNHNINADLGLKSFKLSLNKFADQTPGEMIKRRTGLTSSTGLLKSAPVHYYKPSVQDSEGKVSGNESGIEFDWRSQGIVAQPIDQGECGACWAFTATAVIEGQWALSTGQLVNFSKQQLIDCSNSTGNEGCAGGNMYNAFVYLSENPFVNGEDYPYTGNDNDCREAEIKTKYGQVTSIGIIAAKNESQLAAAVKEIGPIAVAIDASSPYLMFYSEGIYDDPTCTTSVNHAVTIVGYGTDPNGSDYWIVKNSWGPDWGDNGYVKIKRGVNLCGISESAIYALI